MALIIFALVCGIVLMVFLIRSIVQNTRENLRYGSRYDKICEILKIVLCVETAAFIVLFIFVLIKTMMA
ncbi:MAG: hypothetical protein Q4C25_05365 [Bacillota bacterium]|nr:hypothetical protein [Bacillota bacterium]